MELVVVILVMALLAAVGIVAFNQVSSNARIAAAKAELTTVAKAAVAELTMREASAFDAVWVTPLYGEVITEVDAGDTAAGGAFTPLGPDEPLTATGQYGLAFKDLTGQVNATQGVGVTFATWVDGTVVSVSASAAGTIVDHEADNTAAWAGDALNTAVQQRTNLAANPSFEKASVTVVVATNEFANPEPGISGTGAHWGFHPGSTTSSPAEITSKILSDHTLGPCASLTQKTPGGYGSGLYLGNLGTRSTWQSVTPGTTIFISIDVADSEPVERSLYTEWYDADGAKLATGGVRSDYVRTRSDSWTTLSLTVTVPDDAAFLIATAYSRVPVEAGHTAYARRGFIGTPGWGYFDGSTSPDPDVTAEWTGAPNASPSVLRAQAMSAYRVWAQNGVHFLSTKWAQSGERSVRLSANSKTAGLALIVGSQQSTSYFQPGHTYRASATMRLERALTGSLHHYSRRLLANYLGSDGVAVVSAGDPAPNEPGEHRLSFTWTVPPNAQTGGALYLYGGASAGNGDVWWDNLVIEDVTDRVPADDSYFDGDTPSTPRSQYRWTGAPHTSTSVSLTW